MTRLQLYLHQLQFARDYTNRLLDQTDPDTWFTIPAAGVSHIAWQVGHITMAQYRLALERIRGHRPEDDALIAPAFLKAFGRGSVADPAARSGPYSAEDIRDVFDNVHAQAMAELYELADAVLDEAVLKPHALVTTKREAIMWCSHHEILHAGQVGLLRRQLGAEPTW